MPIYLDVIWLLNFLFDSLLLFLTAFILKRNVRKRKIFLGGFIGSLIIWAPLIPYSQVITSPIGKVLISAIMILSVFGYKHLRFFLTNIAVFYLCTFATGGAMFGIHYLMQSDYNFAKTFLTNSVSSFGDPISWLFVIIGFPIILFFSKETFDNIEIVKIKYDQIVEIYLYIKDKKVHLRGLIDSGNHLYDPLTKKPVMIVSLNKTETLFPKELIEVFDDINNLWKLESDITQHWQISVIPYRVVGQENKLLAAIKPKKVEIIKDEEVMATDHVLIAFVRQNFSNDHSFDCILHPKMLNLAVRNQVS